MPFFVACLVILVYILHQGFEQMMIRENKAIRKQLLACMKLNYSQVPGC